MTSDKPTLYDQRRLLEDILDKIDSIDRNVEEIIDHLGEIRYRNEWRNHGHSFGHPNGDELY